MAHFTINFTLSPELSMLSDADLPFFRTEGEQAYLELDVGINHAEIIFLPKNTVQQSFVVDHKAGKLLVELPPWIIGERAHEALFGSRAMPILEEIMYESRFTEEGVAVASPKRLRDGLHFLNARLNDYSVSEDKVVDVKDMSLKLLRVEAKTSSGGKTSLPDRASSFFDRETGLVIDSENAVRLGVAARAKLAHISGFVIKGLKAHFEEMRKVSLSGGTIKATPYSEQTAFHAISYAASFAQIASKIMREIEPLSQYDSDQAKIDVLETETDNANAVSTETETIIIANSECGAHSMQLMLPQVETDNGNMLPCKPNRPSKLHAYQVKRGIRPDEPGCNIAQLLLPNIPQLDNSNTTRLGKRFGRGRHNADPNISNGLELPRYRRYQEVILNNAIVQSERQLAYG